LYLPLHDFLGVFSLTLFLGHLLKNTHCSNNYFCPYSLGICFALCMDLTISVIILFFRSTTPFYWGVYLVVKWCSIPCYSKKYSWPLFVLNALILKPLCFFTNTLNVLMVCHKLLIFVSRNIPKQFSAKVANKSDKMVAAIRCWYFNWTQIWLNYLSSFFTLHDFPVENDSLRFFP
jgi:hypothetical protein